MMADSQDKATPKALFNQVVASSAGGTLTDANLRQAWKAMPEGYDNPRTVLIAPNKRIQKQWRKDYPGIQVILGKDYVGYPLPEGYTEVNDLVATDSQSQDEPLKSAQSDPKRKGNSKSPKGEANT